MDGTRGILRSVSARFHGVPVLELGVVQSLIKEEGSEVKLTVGGIGELLTTVESTSMEVHASHVPENNIL